MPFATVSLKATLVASHSAQPTQPVSWMASTSEASTHEPIEWTSPGENETATPFTSWMVFGKAGQAEHAATLAVTTASHEAGGPLLRYRVFLVLSVCGTRLGRPLRCG